MEFQVHESAPARQRAASQDYTPIWAAICEGHVVSIESSDGSSLSHSAKTPERRLFTAFRARAKKGDLGCLRTGWAEGRRYFWLEKK